MSDLQTKKNIKEITMAQAYDCVMDVLEADLVPILLSSPGIGKSALGKQISDVLKYKFIDERLSSADPTDLNGFPMILDPNAAQVKAGYVPMITFPTSDDSIPEGYMGWLLMLDELPSASMAVQVAAYKIILDKMVGMHPLHKKVSMVCAGNLADDKAFVNRLNTAMQSRLIHYRIRVCHKAWMTWANGPGNIDHRVKGFLNFKPDLLHNFDPNHTDMTFACPRTWEFISKIIKPWEKITSKKIPTLTGTVGDGAGKEFYSYAQVYADIPEWPEILADPANVSFGDEPAMEYALCGIVGNFMDDKTAKQGMKFLSRLQIDFQGTALRAAVAKNYKLREHPDVIAWMAKNAKELL